MVSWFNPLPHRRVRETDVQSSRLRGGLDRPDHGERRPHPRRLLPPLRQQEELYSEAIAGYAGCNATAMDFGAPAGRIVLQMVNAYLSRQHLEDVELHCPMIALPSDVARAGAVVRRTYERQLTGMVGLFEAGIEPAAREARQGAVAMAALCVGGMVLARTLEDADLARFTRRRARSPSTSATLMARRRSMRSDRQIEADGADQDHRDEQRATRTCRLVEPEDADQRDQAAQRPIPRQRSLSSAPTGIPRLWGRYGRRLGLLGLTARRQQCFPALAARYSRATERSSSQCQSAPHGPTEWPLSQYQSAPPPGHPPTSV